MAATFDAYRSSYESVVQDSIAFSGLRHDLFVKAKVALLAELFAAHFGRGARPSLIDVGCGIGVMHDALRPIVGALAGTDLSGEALDRARLDHPGVEYRDQAGPALPWGDAAADATLAVCVLHHVPPRERDGLLAEMRRITRPGGLVTIIEHNPWNPLTRLAVARCSFDHDAVLLGAREGRARLATAGLSRIRSRHFLLLPSLHRTARQVESRFRAVPLGAQYAAYGEA